MTPGILTESTAGMTGWGRWFRDGLIVITGPSPSKGHRIIVIYGHRGPIRINIHPGSNSCAGLNISYCSSGPTKGSNSGKPVSCGHTSGKSRSHFTGPSDLSKRPEAQGSGISKTYYSVESRVALIYYDRRIVTRDHTRNN